MSPVAGLLPGSDAGLNLARCIVLHDFEEQSSPRWLALSERVLALAGQPAETIVFKSGSAKSMGMLSRTRKRVAALLEAASSTAGRVSLRVRSRQDSETYNFFPSLAEICIGSGDTLPGLAEFAVDASVSAGLSEVVSRVAPLMFGALGAAYGYALDFPTSFGPEAYSATVVAVTEGLRTPDEQEYADRLLRWRNRISGGLLPRLGYLREVYPVNFLLQTHLNMPFRGEQLSSYLRSEGTLAPSGFHDAVFRWDVPFEILDRVRVDLEESGLVLSARAEPLPPPLGTRINAELLAAMPGALQIRR